MKRFCRGEHMFEEYSAKHVNNIGCAPRIITIKHHQNLPDHQAGKSGQAD